MNSPTRYRAPLFFFQCLFLFALAQSPAAETLQVPIPGKQSILRVGAIPDPVTDKGRAIATLIMDGLEQKDKGRLSEAHSELEQLVGKEKIGGDYSALHWLLSLVLEAGSADPASLADRPLEQSYKDFFFNNDFANLKEYLQRKYAVNDFRPDEPEQHVARTQFLEDMIIFNNPARSTWDSVTEVMDVIASLGPDVKRIVDVGAGFGFFSHRLALMAGAKGTVYAVDTSEAYVAQLERMTRSYPLGNIVPIVSAEDDVKVSEETDLVFISSLYHVLYSWSPHAKRDPFLQSIKRTLKPGGYLVILDNNFNAGDELHNSYIDKDFVVAQLYFYGFEAVEHRRLNDRRYVLVFRHGTPGNLPLPTFSTTANGRTIDISDSRSAVHIGSLDSFDITPAGIAAAEHLYRALDESDMEAARGAIAIYDNIIPTENFGGEYTALRWIAKYLVAPEDRRNAMTAAPLTAEYLAYLAEDEYKRLKRFLSRKYKLGKERMSAEEALDEETKKIGIVQRQSMEDFILFNNPERESWEKSSLILEKMSLKAGDTVVDVGSGAGYFSFKFADLVGVDGKVYALDTKKPHVDYIESLARKWNTDNLFPSVSSTDGLELEIDGEADVVFMCSLYHILYAVSSTAEREGMLKGMHKVLKPNGRLVIVDNGPVEERTLPYHGPHMRKKLIEAQLAEYGFVLKQSHQIIPQRYMLVFEKQ